MTYTEQDLTDALALEAADVMDVDQLRARVHQDVAASATAVRPVTLPGRARRRVLIPVAIAATVVALATPAAVSALHRDRSASNAAAAGPTLPPLAGPAFTLTTSVRAPHGFSVTNEVVSSGQQRIVVDRQSGYNYGGTTITTYAPGAFEATKFLATATRTTAAGHTAYFGKYPALGGRFVYYLAWKASATQWISIENPPLDDEKPTNSPAAVASARAFAAYVTTRASIDVTTPLQVRYVPAGLQRDEIAAGYPTRDQSWSSEIVLTDPATPARQLTIGVEPAHTGPQSVTVTPNTTVAGHPAQYIARNPVSRKPELRVQLGPNVLLIDGSYARAELGAIAAGVTLVTHPADIKTWHDSMK